MHPEIPLELYYLFLVLVVAIVAFTVRSFRFAHPDKNIYALALIGWFLLQYVAGKLGFFVMGLGQLPPRIMAVVIPNFALLIYVSVSAFGRTFAAPFSLRFLTAVQAFRIVVEVVLWQLAAKELLPSVMSFEGRNFDILVGLSAPLMAYLHHRGSVSKRGMVIWNIAGMVILTNVVVNGFLSVPGIQMIATNVPNFIVSYAPFNLLPGILVPLAYLFHILSMKKLLAPSAA